MKHLSQSFIIALVLYSALLTAAFFSWQQLEQTGNTADSKPLPITLNMFQIEAPTVTPIAESKKSVEKPAAKKPDAKIEPPIQPKPIEAIKTPEPMPSEKKQPVIKQPKAVDPQPNPPKPKTEIEPTKPKPKTESKPEPRLESKPKTQIEPTITEKNFQPDDTPLAPVKPTLIDQTPVKQITANQIEQAEQRYLLELRQQIVRLAEDTYPRIARRRHWQGQVLVEIKLLSDGSIESVKVIKSAKYNILNQAAEEIFTLRMQNRFKPFPEESSRQNWVIKVPVNYRLY